VGFDVDVAARAGGRTLAASFASEGGLTVLFGRSGAGKTSALDMVAGLRRPDRGHVRVGGETLFDAAARIDLPPERRRLGYVFQDARLFPHRRVRANLLYGHALARPEDRWLPPGDAIALLGLGDLLDRWPRTLSGGEQRRVAIGRALLSGARALLMDEPLSFLDRARREEVMTAIERVRDELALPILYVTHDAEEAERLATRIVAIG
jgi:molybdate transport system ATP-binding protein